MLILQRRAADLPANVCRYNEVCDCASNHPLSLSFHECEEKDPPLPTGTKHLSLNINYALKLVSKKTLKSRPFKAIAAFVVAQCTIHNEL